MSAPASRHRSSKKSRQQPSSLNRRWGKRFLGNSRLLLTRPPELGVLGAPSTIDLRPIWQIWHTIRRVSRLPAQSKIATGCGTTIQVRTPNYLRIAGHSLSMLRALGPAALMRPPIALQEAAEKEPRARRRRSPSTALVLASLGNVRVSAQTVAY